MLVVAIGSESRRYLRGRGDHMHVVCMSWWLATARPPAGTTDHGLATYKGRPDVAKASLQGGDAGCHPRVADYSAAPASGGSRPRPARKGRQPPTASPQGATDYRFNASRKAAYGQRHRPQGLPLAGAATAAVQRGQGEG
ncbi:hypothetical protein GW17_00060073 [Ensete ventricosum]|nr:hypothetical protein GW17_00060073 [Ensete ventricosum]